MCDPFDGKRFRILILGAGFSQEAGLPLGPELFAEIRRRAASVPGGDWLADDLDYFIKYKRRCDGKEITSDTVDFEEFLSFLDIEHFLGLRGGDTWSREGNETQVLVKKLIGKIIFDRSPKSPDELATLYIDFAEALRPNDFVLTFNYDTLVEQSLNAIGKPFRLFPSRYKKIGVFGHIGDDSKDEVVVIKLHGSIDWFDRSNYDVMVEASEAAYPQYKPNDPIFGPNSTYTRNPLLEGPQEPDNPLRNIYRVQELDQLYDKALPVATPFILSPSHSKILYAPPLRDFWFGLGKAGGMNFGMGIVGFSLSGHDEYVRQVVYRLTRNFTDFEPDLNALGVGKTKLALIDLRASPDQEEEFRKRYRFVNWDRSTSWFKGFNQDSLKVLFADNYTPDR